MSSKKIKWIVSFIVILVAFIIVVRLIKSILYIGLPLIVLAGIIYLGYRFRKPLKKLGKKL